jgi:hypothetical protein
LAELNQELFDKLFDGKQLLWRIESKN